MDELLNVRFFMGPSDRCDKVEAERVVVISAEDRSAIEALHRAWLDAELRGDSPALLQFCTPVPVWLPPNQMPLCGRAAILQWLGRQPPAAVLRIDIDDLEISGTGSFAWKAATFRTTFAAPGESGAGIVTGSHGWLLQHDDAGQWRISVVAWTITGTSVA
jgi:ketosteroid isomerase-like protein